MAKINHLDDNLNIEGKRVLLRVDFNVPELTLMFQQIMDQ